MAGTPITSFERIPSSDAISRCSGEFSDVVEFPGAEWPDNIISRKMVVYGSGRIARDGDPVRHNVDPDELALCRRLTDEADRMACSIEYGLASEPDEIAFEPFFMAANLDDPTPIRIDGAWIRSRFGGTIFPPATVTIEPLDEASPWFASVQYFFNDDPGSDQLAHWRRLINWFRGRPEFTDSAFVEIGDELALSRRDLKGDPEGTMVAGCIFPRLLLGLTRNGSLSGVITSVILT
jgi:hypothetical protein